MPPNDNPRKQELAPLKELELQPSTIETIDRAIFEFVDDKVTTIVDASVDYNDSEILNEWEDLLDVHTVLEEAND